MEISELAKALCQFQSECGVASKDRKNPHFGNEYATLASVWAAIRPHLKACGLCVIQLPSDSPVGIALTTTLMHASGQSISSTIVMPVDRKNAQGVGSALTYARRYALCAMLGIVADEDDDGNAAATSPPTSAARNGRHPAPPQSKPTGITRAAIGALMRNWAEATYSDPKADDAKEKFVAFVKDALGTDDDMGKAENWDAEALAIVGEKIRESERRESNHPRKQA